MRTQSYYHLLLLFILVSLTSLCCSIPHEFSIVGDPSELLSEEQAYYLFQEWKEEQGKVYRNDQEKEMRFQNFKRNLKYILDKNSERTSPSGIVLGLNKFADMSNEEFKEVYISKVKKPLRRSGNGRERRSLVETSCDAPSSLDWRNYGVVTGVKDQGHCGSCWAFSSTGAMEGMNAMVAGDLVSLSEQELVDCVTTSNGCNGGFMGYAFEWVIDNGGIHTQSDYPYTATDGTCNITKEKTKVVSIDGYTDVEQEESSLLCAVAKQPVSVAIDASTLDFQLYIGGIYDGKCSNDPSDIDHAVLIVGYGSDSEGGEDYWIVKNSWGTSWGMDGYIYIRRNTDLEYGVCAISAMAAYPTKESQAATASPLILVKHSDHASPSPSPTLAVVSPPPVHPAPSPTRCGLNFYCPLLETCCCLFEIANVCMVYGCCAYDNGVCCPKSKYCCPGDYPICDIQNGLCLKNTRDGVGVAAKEQKMAKHKFPWIEIEETSEKDSQILKWKRKELVAAIA